MKNFRLLIGLFVITAAVWLIATEQLSGTSADATINAQLISIRTPIAGVVDMPPLPLGARLNQRQELAQMRNERADVVRLNDLQLELDLIKETQEDIAARTQTIQRSLDYLNSREEIYSAARITEIRVRLEAAKDRLSVLDGLEEGGLIDADAFVENTANDLGKINNLELALIYAREQVALLSTELTTAEQGTFLGDAYNDAPFSEQRRIELDLQQEQLVDLSAQLERRATAYMSRLAAERIYLNLFQRHTVRSPVSGVLFEKLAVSGEVVEKGDPIMTVADCSSIVVTLSVSEALYSRLNVGDQATYRPRGSGKVFEGTVTRLAGAGAGRIYADLAVAPSEKHLERHDVTLLVPRLRVDPKFDCAIGRTGRAYFDNRPLDWVRGFFETE